MNKDIDAQFLCKNCERYDLCKYYHSRKEDSYICKYFHLPKTNGQEPRWIPVSERLPEKAFGCLVTVEEDDIYGDSHRVIYPDFVGYDGTWNDADGEGIPFDVIAWMPLPEPYKAESED